MFKKALIFGITGQDGFYLNQLLLSKNYEVHGVTRSIKKKANLSNNYSDTFKTQLHEMQVIDYGKFMSL